MFQFHHLLPAFTALENVMLPGMIGHGTATPEAEAMARDLLARVGLKGAEHKRPGSCRAACSSAWPLRGRCRCGPG